MRESDQVVTLIDHRNIHHYADLFSLLSRRLDHLLRLIERYPICFTF